MHSQKLDLMCRFCMSYESDLQPIFMIPERSGDRNILGTDSANGPATMPTLPQMIRICIRLEVGENDDFPQLICSECTYQLNKSYSFRQQCHISFGKLKEIIFTCSKLENDSSLPETQLKLETLSSNDDEPQQSSSSIERQTKEILYHNHAYGTEQKSPRKSPVFVTMQSNYIDEYLDLEEPTFDDQLIKKENVDEDSIVETTILTDGKPCCCKLCGKWVNTVNDLVYHCQRFHDTSKRYQCDICKYTFKKRPRMIDHMLLHKETEDSNQTLPAQTIEALPKSAIDHTIIALTDENFVVTTQRRKSKKTKATADKKPSTPTNLIGLSCPICGEQHLLMEKHIHTMHADMDEKPCSCDICGKWVPSKSKLIRHHYRVHVAARKYQCDICKYAYKTRPNLIRHMQGTHINTEELRQTARDQINRTTNTPQDIIVPKRGRKPGKRNKTIQMSSPKNGRQRKNCPICGEKRLLLEQHILIMHTVNDEKPCCCEICGKWVNSASKLFRHNQRVHVDVAKYQCDLCDFAFKTRPGLVRHMKTRRHSKRKTQLLRQQSAVFDDSANNEDNGIGHNRQRQKRVKLEIADENVSKKMDNTSENGGKPPKERHMQICPICGEQRILLENHILTMHTDTVEKPCCCEICGKLIKSHSKLIRHHYRVHVSIRKYNCDICKCAFKTRPQLIRHMLSHSKVRSHECNVCGNRFRDLSTLRGHMRLHAEDKPIECPQCDKRFISRGGLNNHIGIHTGEYLYNCELCPKSFKYSSSATVHRREHMIDKSYFECGTCQFHFKRYTSLKLHLRSQNHHFNDYFSDNVRAN